jgi:uncharacterized protein YggE
MDRLITVTGAAEVKKAPELAHLSLYVHAIATTAKKAGEKQSQLMHLVLGTLLGLGIPNSAIKTQRFSVNQAHRYDETKKQHVPDGFNANQQLLVTIPAEDVEEVMGMLANHPIQTSVSFGLKDHDKETNEALCLAIANAKQKARAMSEACGATLGAVVSCQEGGGHRGGAMRAASAMPSAMGGGSAPELPMGEIEIHAAVTMQYELCVQSVT